MAKTLYLHIGHHKTGTTSVQDWLSANRKILLEQQIFYPKISAITGPESWRKAHHDFYPALFGLGGCPAEVVQRLGKNEAEALKNSEHKFCRFLRECEVLRPEKIVLSSEAFFSVIKRSQILTAVEKLKEISEEVRLIVYVRDPLDFLLSSLSTQILSSHRVEFPPHNVRREVLESWMGIDGVAISVLKYDRPHLYCGDSMADILYRFFPEMVESYSQTKSNSKNISLSPEAMQVLMDQRRAGEFQNRGWWLRYRIYGKLIQKLDRLVSNRRASPLLQENFENQLYKLASDMDWLNDNWGVNFATSSDPHCAEAELPRPTDVDAIFMLDEDRLAALRQFARLVKWIARL